MKNTRIEWCDSTWNPITGCYNNCDYCFAKRIAQRFGGSKSAQGKIPNITNTNYGIIADLEKPMLDTNKKIAAYPFHFSPTLHRYRLDQPKKWKEPQTIFVCSMADLFGDWVPSEWITEVFKATEAAPQHRYLFLTKNPAKMFEYSRYLTDHKNYWFGTTITTPEQAFMTNGTGTNTFLSIEPLHSDFEKEIPKGRVDGVSMIDWVIIGAETGNREGKIVPKPEWIKHITDRCDEYKIPVFMKDSLIKIIGNENMRREFPWDKKEEG